MSKITFIRGERMKPEYILQAVQLDYLVYEEEYYLPEERCLAYFKRNPSIYIMALDEEKDEILGYVNFSPVTKALYMQMREGTSIDIIIEEEDLEIYEDNHMYWIYFSSIVVHPKARGMGIAGNLIRELKEMISELSKRGIGFHGIVADVISDSGEKIASDFDMKVLKESNHQSKIMEWRNGNE